MTGAELSRLLGEVRSGAVAPEEAQRRLLQALSHAPFEDLGFARIDHHRIRRQGFPEVVFGPGKTPEQIAAISERIVAEGHSLLVTRTTREVYNAVAARVTEARFHALARTITLPLGDLPPGRGTIVVAAAGTADLPVAEEAAISAELMGNVVDRVYDVGVAGLHRLLAEHARLTSARVIIAVAGMEGALPSVIGGLVACPVVAVPTSVGYGASFGGLTALMAMLNSCASGVSVVNIDNGFGAAAVASSINHLE
jgi:hypothetical protein